MNAKPIIGNDGFMRRRSVPKVYSKTKKQVIDELIENVNSVTQRLSSKDIDNFSTSELNYISNYFLQLNIVISDLRRSRIKYAQREDGKEYYRSQTGENNYSTKDFIGYD